MNSLNWVWSYSFSKKRVTCQVWSILVWNSNKLIFDSEVNKSCSHIVVSIIWWVNQSAGKSVLVQTDEFKSYAF